jgi:hypothetical protein
MTDVTNQGYEVIEPNGKVHKVNDLARYMRSVNFPIGSMFGNSVLMESAVHDDHQSVCNYCVANSVYKKLCFITKCMDEFRIDEKNVIWIEQDVVYGKVENE